MNRPSSNHFLAFSFKKGKAVLALPSFLAGAREPSIALGSLLAIGLITLLNRWTGAEFCLGLLYLLPIAAAAWWCGLAHGLLLSVIGACTWFTIDLAASAAPHTAVSLVNGAIRLGTFSLVSSLLYRLRLSMLREQSFAQTDPLTGVLNVRSFYDRLLVETERAARTDRPLSLAYIDLDHFKALNDELGHRVGDAALVQFARVLTDNLRRADALGRVGGDEFCLLLPETGADGALLLLTRLQCRVARAMSGQGWPITTSIGAATFRQPPRDLDQMIQRVDVLMYGAKRGGKNRINHEYVPAGAGSGALRHERRAAARLGNCRKVRVRPAAAAAGDFGLGWVQNISISGLGLSLPRKLAPETSLLIEPAVPCDLGPLVVRVVRTEIDAGAWFYGCELSLPLTDEELHGWVGPASASAATQRVGLEPGDPLTETVKLDPVGER